MKNKKTKSRSRFEKLLTIAVPPKKSSLYMESNSELSIFRCDGLLEYNDECVNLRVSDGTVHIFGKDLSLKTFSNTEITVSGSIERIEFEIKETKKETK